MLDCLVIDDDEVTRELSVLFAAEAGFPAVAVASGEEALALLLDRPAPYAVLMDMQMPGLSGAALAAALRVACGPQTLMLAMSANPIPQAAQQAFDAFLRKPFSVAQLQAALTGRPALSEATFHSLAASMPRAQLTELYTLCLDDAERRIGLMHTLLEAGDGDAYRRAAHAIRGGCGMLGALELAALAGEMEEEGEPTASSAVSLDNFLLASARLRRIVLDRSA